MVKIVNLKERYIGTHADYVSAVRRRNELMFTKPIVEREITEIDLWLVDNPHTKLSDRIAAMSRAVFVQHLLYWDHDAEGLHLPMLLSLREQYRDFQALPEHAQRAMEWIWACWADLLEEEEAYA